MSLIKWPSYKQKTSKQKHSNELIKPCFVSVPHMVSLNLRDLQIPGEDLQTHNTYFRQRDESKTMKYNLSCNQLTVSQCPIIIQRVYFLLKYVC